MIVLSYRFLGMWICGQGLNTKVTNICLPKTIIIIHNNCAKLVKVYLFVVMIIPFYKVQAYIFICVSY